MRRRQSTAAIHAAHAAAAAVKKAVTALNIAADPAAVPD
jgi:hypothetical protein